MTAAPPAAVADAFPTLRVVTGWHWLAAAGGFSGAGLWRGDGPAGPVAALKRWPAGTSPASLTAIHTAMRAAAAAGCDFVPEVFGTSRGGSVAVHAGRCYDAQAWRPGTPALAFEPTAARVASAAAALGRLHGAWAGQQIIGVCPAVLRRHRVLSDWLAAPAALPPSAPPELLAAAAALTARLPAALAALSPWLARPLALQPVHGDPWRDHVLFTGDRVTGLIDFGAFKQDHPAADVARLLAEVARPRPELLAEALAAYPAPLPAGLVAALALGGLAGALAAWSRRFAAGVVPEAQRVAALERVGRLAAALQSLPLTA